jgi:hypothetical protein
MRNVCREVETSTKTGFSRQQANQRQASPLPETKRLQQLPFGVLKGERDRLYGGDWQGSPRHERVSSKVLRSGQRSKSNLFAWLIRSSQRISYS